MSMLNLMKGIAQASGAVGLVAWVAQESLYNVDGGERAVIFDRFNGVRSESLDLVHTLRCL